MNREDLGDEDEEKGIEEGEVTTTENTMVYKKKATTMNEND